MAGVKKEACDLQGPGVVNYVLEQLAEVATIKNEHGVDEELYILYPPQKAEAATSEEVTDGTSPRRRKPPDKFRDYLYPGKRKGPDCETSTKQEDSQLQDTIGQTRNGTESLESLNTKPNEQNMVTGKDEPAIPRKRGRPSKVNINDETGFKCQNCSKVFSLKGNLKVHMRIHSGEKPYTCSSKGCDKTFRSKDALRKHFVSHSGEKLWKCASCNKDFSSKVSLIEHEARHSNTKAYKCDTCNMEFRQYSCLSRHLLTHTETFPYSCTLCKKSFKMAIYLKSHMRVHTGETPYECSTCNKKFKHQSDLTRHKIIHSGTKPYACKICGVQFSDNSCRRRHEREHLTKATFKCKLCQVTFKKIEKLKTHMISAHFSQQDITLGQSEITALLKELDQMTNNKDSTNQYDFLQQGLTTQPKSVSPPITVAQVGNVLEKRMITHHVSVPRVQGQPVVIDPYTLLEHIKDQLDPSQMPQTINGEPLQVCHKIIQENMDHVIVELQYLSTVQVSSSDIASSVSMTTVEKEALTCEQFLPVSVEQSPPLEQTTQVVRSLSELNTGAEFIATVNVDSANSGIENLGAYIDISEIDEGARAFQAEQEALKSEYTGNIISETVEATNKNLHTNKTSEILSSPLTASCIENPDFSEQYYGWLNDFCEACKALEIPLEQSLFESISSVNKQIADVMASPKGVMTDRSKFITCLSVSKDLTAIIESHHNYILNCFNQNKSIS